MQPRELLAEFDAWEEQMRGWTFWPTRVPLEPPFTPLFASSRLRAGVIDDARKPSILERLVRGDHESRTASREDNEAKQPETPPTRDIVEIELLVPRDFTARVDVVRRLLVGVHSLTEPVSYEILAFAGRTIIQLTCGENDRFGLMRLLRSYLPEVKSCVRHGQLIGVWDAEDAYTSVCHLGAGSRAFLSLRTADRLELDPLAEIIGELEDVQDGEAGVIQILLQRAQAPWGPELERLVNNIDDVDKVGPRIREKFSEPTFAVVARTAAVGQDEERTWSLSRNLARALYNVTRTEDNELIPIDTGALHDLSEEVADIVDRETHRSGMLLSLPELITIVHPPAASIRSEKLARQSQSTRAAPLAVVGNEFVIGLNEHDGETTPVALSPAQRRQHAWILGGSGSGKSTMIVSMATQDIEMGNGFAVLDAHGDLIEEILARVPEDRARDVVLFDPSDEEFPIGFNILSAHSELERTLLASDLVSVFRRLSSSFGDVMVSVLGNAALAFLESPEGGTIVDLRDFLVDAAYRAKVLATVRDEEVVGYWKREFPLLRGVPHAPVLTRLNAFLRPRLVRRMVAQKDDRLDFRRIMDTKTIFLAKLSHGAIGEENAYLLGSLLVSRFTQTALSRQDVDAAKRDPYMLYIDEAQNFVTPSLATILTGTRKYGLGLILSHQSVAQLRSKSDDVANAVLANAATRIVFRVGEQDAKSLAEGFAHFEPRDLQALGVGEAIARIERADHDFNLHTEKPRLVPEDLVVVRRSAVLTASRASYATAREEVDRILRGRVADLDSTDSPAPSRRSKLAPERSETSVPAAAPGRGGAEHKYIQDLIRRLGEERGFIVSIEKRVLGGHGHVDVALERDDLSIGCEISVSTRAAHEIRNLAKLLAAGFDYAVFITSKERVRRAAQRALADSSSERMRFLTAECFVAFLDEIAPVPSAKKRKRMPEQPETRPTGLIAADRAAIYIGLKPQTLAKMRVKGTSPPFHKVGSRVLYDVADLDAWLSERKQRSTSDVGTHNPRK